MSPAFVNRYTPPIPPPEILPASSEPHDINYAFPLYSQTLTSARVRLEPFVPTLHADALWAGMAPHAPELFRYYPIAGTKESWVAKLEDIRQQPECITFTIYDRTRNGAEGGDGEIAGMVSLINTSGADLKTEIGFIMVLPAFQRTHVARTTVGLLLRYCLEPPESQTPGLGFRRVAWCANSRNAPSIGLARRLGFRDEGILRFTWVLPNVDYLNAEGTEVRRRFVANNGEVVERTEGWARDSATLSLCWDDWQDGKREYIASIIQG
ncbi:acyl-CoA N-acyltransferase [Wolfiporia cocos MD-104 SS10]|uniref:Acyl-CoA N-acyltransferase n=1 Tax=Wolfiporia cocos (strain MD-104) TaxID=742152 RepID=A0A2H3K1P5_WOLCO|nr:acyl-CoA N-acyltransferase [Wolfiporia cocos MD-104 SS10]